MIKVCSKCKRELPITQFYKRAASKDGLAHRCKECDNARIRIWQIKNKERHNKNQLNGMKNRLDKGLCKHCASVRLPGHNKFCEKHYIVNVAKAAIGSASNDIYCVLLDKLNKQGWKCPYTSEKLVLGENTQLDHILPISRFPGSRYDINNVEWVSTKVNQAKRDLTKQEFIELCQKVCSNL